MAEQITEQQEAMPEEAALRARVDASRAAWRRLWLRLRAIAPVDLMRYLLVGGALAFLGWLVVFAWPALVPFVVGLGLAYAALPLVNALDRVMPRRLAALLSMLLALGFLLLVAGTIVPALVRQFLRFIDVVPPPEEIQGYVGRLEPLLTQLPESLQLTINNWIDEASVILLQRLEGLGASVPQLLASALLRLVNVVGAALGLLVLPTWLLVVLKDQREGTQTLNRILPEAVKADFWAVVRIVDRAFRAFLHGQVTQGFVAGLLTYLVVTALSGGGYLEVEYPLVVTLFVGLMELVPEIGPIVAVVVIGISTLLQSPVNALLAILLYLLIHSLAAAYVGSRTRRRVKELHPALLIVGAVALSELGLLWVLLSVPLLTAGRDLLSYAHARLSNPPRPAGLIPGEEPPPEEVVQTAQRVPSVYRRAAAQRER